MFEQFGRYRDQKYEKMGGKTWKISLVPMPRKENLADLFLTFPHQLQMRSPETSFIRIPLPNFPEMKSF